MKAFESALGPLLQSYIEYRTGLGFSEKNLRSQLLRLDRYVLDQKTDLGALDPPFFLELKKRLRNKPGVFNAILLAARGFFAYLVRRQIVTENPLRDIDAYAPKAFIPFIFSKEQTDALLYAAQTGIRRDKPEAFFRDYSVYMAIVLLARSGLRIREPLRLTIADYQSSQKTIFIEKTKFSKDRLIPLPMATAEQLDTYMKVRSALLIDDNPYLFAGARGRSLHVKHVYRCFDQSVKQIGIDNPKIILGNTTFGKPTPHSLRHSFAVNTLKTVKERGGCPRNALPVLSAYLGHVKYRYTAVYLKVLDAEHRSALVDFAIGRQEEL